MEEKIKIRNEFRLWLDSIPNSDYKKIKRKVIEECKTQDYIFRNWKYGLTKVPILESIIINRISEEYNGKIIFLNL